MPSASERGDSLPEALQVDTGVIETHDLIKENLDDTGGLGKVDKLSSKAALATTDEDTADLLGRALELCKSYGGIPVLFPLPLPARPVKSQSGSARLRRRFEKRLSVWKVVVKIIRGLNRLDAGDLKDTYNAAAVPVPMMVAEARQKIVGSLLREAAKFVQSRRAVPTGDYSDFNVALHGLMKNSRLQDGYCFLPSGPAQVPLRALSIAEPPADHPGLDMLEALPPQEAVIYSSESNIVDWCGKSETILQELYEQFCFIGGSTSEYINYFHRSDVSSLWQWEALENVKCIGGFSTVPKKCGILQRKLLMQVPFNYLMRDISSRSAVGMNGGRSVTRLRTQGAMQAAACDQSNAFTSIRVPKWMVRYQGTPPIPAKYVWALLPDELRNKLHHHSMVSACYRRLAMGSAHAVHILMMINLRIIGIAIRSHRFLVTNTTRPTNDTHADELIISPYS